jgi:hypothetical protein
VSEANPDGSCGSPTCSSSIRPALTAGRDAVDACVKVGDRNILLASLSAERSWAELQSPVMLDKRFSFYVTPHGGDSAADADADADADTDTDNAVVVQFEGYLLAWLSRECKHETGGKEAVSSADEENNENEVCEEEDKVNGEQTRV